MRMRMHAERGCTAPTRIATLIGTLALLVGCATQSEPTRQLQSARSAYQKLEENPEAARSAAEALGRSERELEQAEKLLAEGADMALVDHHAYLAERYAQIADNQVRQALLAAEINRITVSRCTGHGRAQGTGVDEELYRGQTVVPNLLPKVRILPQ